MGEEGGKAIAQHLTELTFLHLERNKIGEGGAKAIAERLTALTFLDLRGNKIGDEGVKAILDLFLNSPTRTVPPRLRLGNNDSTILPKEVLEQDDAEALLAAYRSFKHSAEQRNIFPLN